MIEDKYEVEEEVKQDFLSQSSPEQKDPVIMQREKDNSAAAPASLYQHAPHFKSQDGEQFSGIGYK